MDFIEKSFDNDDVIARVRKAIARSGDRRSDDVDKQAVNVGSRDPFGRSNLDGASTLP